MSAQVQMAEVARIASWLETLCDDDERLFADMLAGESDIDRIMTRLNEQLARDEELVVGITARQANIADRKKRINDRIAATKAAMGQFLRAGKLPKIELPEATISVRDGKPSLRIVDPAAVPAEYQRIKSEPDKTAINEAFAGTETLPNWLTSEPARDVVSVRTK